MNIDVVAPLDPAAEYLRTYREWCQAFGLKDPCMEELKAAILIESQRESHTIAQRDRLEILLGLIECEQAGQWKHAA